MEVRESKRLHVMEPSQVGEARRLAAALSLAVGFDETRIGHVSTVVTELATNLLKHAQGGDLVLSTFQVEDQTGIAILSLDKGPGIRNINESLRDGYSTAGSPGTGLGAIQRLSTTFDLYSTPGQGVAALSRIMRQSSPVYIPYPSAPANAPELGMISLPVKGEEECGDTWATHQSPGRTLVLLADGLGHGHFAAEAAGEARIMFHKYAHLSPGQIIAHMHNAMRHTRGAAVAIAELILSQRILRYAGVGNISGRILSDTETHSLISYNGTVGLEARRIQEMTYPWPNGGLLIMNSDGVDSRWNLDNYPGLRRKHPTLIAGVLFCHHNRPNDDASILVFNETGGPAWD